MCVRVCVCVFPGATMPAEFFVYDLTSPRMVYIFSGCVCLGLCSQYLRVVYFI